MSKHAPIILQQTDTECGIACLAMLFAYHQHHIPIEELRDNCMIGRDGCKAKTIIEVAHAYGFKADAYRVEINALRQLTAPIIAHWNFSHYVVINRIKKSKVYLNDPAFGNIMMDLDEFDRCFTGIIIDIRPDTHFKQRKKHHHYLLSLRFLLYQYRYELLFFCLCAMMINAIPYFAILEQKVIASGHAINHNESTNILIVCLGLSAYLITNYIQKLTQLDIIYKQTLTASGNAIRHLLRLPLAFHLLRHQSELAQIQSRIEALIGNIKKASVDIIISTLAISLCIGLIARLNTWAWILSLISLSIQLVTHFIIESSLSINEQSNAISATKRNAFTTNCLYSLETIHTCSLQNTMSDKWQRLLNISLKKVIRSNHSQLIKSLITKAHHAIIAISLLFMIKPENEEVGIYYALHFILFHHTAMLLNTIGAIKKSAIHHQRLHDIASYQIEPSYTNNTITQANQEIYALSCKNLTYYHNPRLQPVLNKLNFSIKKGQHIAFIGHSGAGKSTLARILCGLHPNYVGEIIINGKLLNRYSASDRSKVIAYVSQNTSLFSGSLLDNILFDMPFNAEEIDRAIHTSCLEKLISKHGLQTPIIHGGDNLSGGEKQRIDIARALLQKAPIIILDEATSALDENTQLELIQRLKSTDKTIIFIAHRLSSIQHCDQIITLHHGEIIKHEYRTH